MVVVLNWTRGDQGNSAHESQTGQVSAILRLRSRSRSHSCLCLCLSASAAAAGRRSVPLRFVRS